MAFAIQLTFSQELSKAKLFDTFSYQGGDLAIARLENFYVELTNDENNFGYIIVYGSKIGKRGEINAHIQGIKEYFTYIRKNEYKNYKIISGGFRENLEIELWIVPENACPPLPSPTVEFEKVRYKGVAPKIYHYWCYGCE